MLLQGIEPWKAGAVQDTVAALLEDAAYRRSFWSSIGGRLLTELGRLVAWIFDAVRGIPGGRTTVLTVLAVVLLLILGRLFLAGQWGEDTVFRRRPGAMRASRFDPWTEAESLAAAGDYMGAVHALYQAVLRRLALTERIRVHSSKTSGDYTRELRRRGSPLAGHFQAFGRRFDRVVFGNGVCTPDDWAALRRDALAIPDRQAAA
ncbi:MAG TPA: DUF4129 domain-containing protein [Gemmatimonadaceae bacterium]|nr:DUF4129 domain-containing protein [Gemmatimonadaceae bacterium]